MYQTGYYATGQYATGYYSRFSGTLIAEGYTYEDLISQARALTNDPDICRFSDELFVEVLNRGMNELNRMRPDAFYLYYGQYGDGVPEVVIGTPANSGEVNWSDEFHPDSRFFSAMVYYVTTITGSIDDAHIASGATSGGMELFRSLVLGI
jgi:hypothetical protein